MTAEGSLKTIRPMSGAFYDFLIAGKELKISEHVAKSGAPVLELLNGSSPEQWGGELPVRLRQLHSHWLDRASGTILLRSVCLPDRTTSFLARLDGGWESGAATARCYRVPQHLASKSAAELLQLPANGKLTDVLVIWATPPIRALSKFEPLELVHFYWDGARYLVELPRYRLEFALFDRRLESCEFAGYHLAGTPQLDDTLPGFTQCLVLSPGNSLFNQAPWTGGLTKILVPYGDVQCVADLVALFPGTTAAAQNAPI